MSSLSARLLISVSVLMLFFFGATIVVLDTAFVSAGEQSREDILDGYLMQLLAAAEPNDSGDLGLPIDLYEAGFNSIDSGLYAELRGNADTVIWNHARRWDCNYRSVTTAIWACACSRAIICWMGRRYSP